VSYQRERWRKGKLTKSNLRRLNEIGFNFTGGGVGGGGGGAAHTPRASCDMEGVSTTSEGVPKRKSMDGGFAAGAGQSSYDEPDSDQEMPHSKRNRSNKYGSYTQGNGNRASKGPGQGQQQRYQEWQAASESDTESEEMAHRERARRQQQEVGAPSAQSMAATLKRTAQQLSSYADEVLKPLSFPPPSTQTCMPHLDLLTKQCFPLLLLFCLAGCVVAPVLTLPDDTACSHTLRCAAPD
jgi:hypothetical protein